LKQAWEQFEATWAEVDVLRKTMVVLAEDQHMDEVLDTLLRYVHEVVPYTSATVLFDEEGGRLFVARESPSRPVNRPVITFEVADHPLLQRAVLEKKGVHVADAANEGDWREIKCLGKISSCMAVPLVVGKMLQGLLLVVSVNPRTFTKEHFRLAKLLAIPFAVAVHRARLREWAYIYADERAELIKRAEAVRAH
jgi:GAF domain-containing protein